MSQRKLIYFIRVFGQFDDVYDYMLRQLTSGAVDYTKPIEFVFDIGGVLLNMRVPVPTPPNQMLN